MISYNWKIWTRLNTDQEPPYSFYPSQRTPWTRRGQSWRCQFKVRSTSSVSSFSCQWYLAFIKTICSEHSRRRSDLPITTTGRVSVVHNCFPYIAMSSDPLWHLCGRRAESHRGTFARLELPSLKNQPARAPPSVLARTPARTRSSLPGCGSPPQNTARSWRPLRLSIHSQDFYLL